MTVYSELSRSTLANMNEAAHPGLPLLVFAEQCDRGKVREENQDRVLHMRTAVGEFSIVADGIGGLDRGAIASRIVVESFYDCLESLPPDYPPVAAIHEACRRANANILAAVEGDGALQRRMGSTVVLALLQQHEDETNAWIGHIGDSRAYLVRDGQISRLTSDHSAVQLLLNQNLITPEEAGNHPDASVLTRSLGRQSEVDIDVSRVPLTIGDTLLLCSDGLWGFVPEQELETVMADAHLPLEETAEALMEMALAAGGHDNIGIELVRLCEFPVPSPKDAEPPRRRGFMGLMVL
jgi:serine/threonine protein phosphatase PrpC